MKDRHRDLRVMDGWYYASNYSYLFLALPWIKYYPLFKTLMMSRTLLNTNLSQETGLKGNLGTDLVSLNS